MAKKRKTKQHIPQNTGREVRNRRKKEVQALLFLVILGFILYARSVTFDYVFYDDPQIIFDNPNIQAGFTVKGVVWAFTTPNLALYQPLPNLSYMLDSHIFGKWAGGYHLTTLIWHLLCVSALFITLLRLLDNFPVAFATTLIFSVHPVNALIVNWVMARNEIMYAFFIILSINFYQRFTVSKSYMMCSISVACMLFAFMAKQSGVLLPVLFLLLDYWPLRRLTLDFRNLKQTLQTGARLVLEKIPWFAVSIIGTLLAFYGKTEFGVLKQNLLESAITRVGVVFITYTHYLFDILYPFGYINYCPPSLEWTGFWITLCSMLILVVFTIIVLLFYARKPYLILGWGWFGLLLLPLSGLVVYSHESNALRYLYLPAIGIYFILVFFIYEMCCSGTTQCRSDDTPNYKMPVRFKAIIGVLSLVLAVLCFWQSSFWKDTETLSLRALALTDNKSALAHIMLAKVYQKRGNILETEQHLKLAATLEPERLHNQVNYAMLLAKLQRYEEARQILEPMIEKYADNLAILNLYGELLIGSGNYDEATVFFRRVLDIEPDFVNSLYNIALCLAKQNKPEQAIPYIERIKQINPNDARTKQILDMLKMK